MSLSDAMNEAIRQANRPAGDTPEFIWVGPGFIARYMTQVLKKPTSESEALAWLEKHGQWDESVGCWRLDVDRRTPFDGIPITENPTFDNLDTQ